MNPLPWFDIVVGIMLGSGLNFKKIILEYQLYSSMLFLFLGTSLNYLLGSFIDKSQHTVLYLANHIAGKHREFPLSSLVSLF